MKILTLSVAMFCTFWQKPPILHIQMLQGCNKSFLTKYTEWHQSESNAYNDTPTNYFLQLLISATWLLAIGYDNPVTKLLQPCYNLVTTVASNKVAPSMVEGGLLLFCLMTH